MSPKLKLMKNKTNRKSLDVEIHFFLAEDLFNTNQIKNNQIVNQAVDPINELRNAVTRKEIPENENPKEITDITERILNFNDQSEGARVKTLTSQKFFKDYQ